MKDSLLFALALATSAALVLPTASQAAEKETVTAIVHTADLDVASATGRLELQRRIVRAAYDVCGAASDVDLEGKNAVRRCREDTIANASAQRDQFLAAARSGSPILIASAR